MEYSSEIVPERVRRQSTITPAGKRMLQPLISEVEKKMKMSSNIAKKKREEREVANILAL